MRFLETDGGRSFSKRPKQRADCTVMSVANACGVSYDEAFEALRSVGRKNNCAFMFPHPRCFSAQIGDWWFEYWEPMKPVTVAEFVRDNRKGSWVVGLRDHVFALKNGIVRDEELPDGDMPIVEVWSVSPVPKMPLTVASRSAR